MNRNVLGQSAAEVLHEVFGGTDGPVLAATPTGSLVRPLAQVADDLDDPPPVELFTTEQSAKDLRGQAPVATKVAELLASDDDPVRLLPPGLRATAVVTPDDVVAIARTADQAAGLPAASSLASSLRTQYREAFADARSALFRVPPRSTVLNTVATELGDEVAADVDAFLTVMESLDAVSLSEASTAFVLGGARHECELYRIRNTVEDAGFASQATVTRRKQLLERAGFVTTRKRAADIGRPRQVLVVPDDAPADDPERIVESVDEMEA
ncbi:DUF5821 family protein [Halobaculum sp. MBLA0143]|uniref:transcriptional regulator TbsP domain-containing protein n=1 Tax=Halobaculum sp. MBLA0143 TaxID=3079933 RepID=UPI0035244D76